VTSADDALMGLVGAIVAGDSAGVSRLLATSPQLASAQLAQGADRQHASDYMVEGIGHYVYAGDTALHMAAAAHRAAFVSSLVAAGADVHAGNRRGARPLHYAADGVPGSPGWDPQAQRETVARLLAAGADPNAVDGGGVTPLHRAVRNRCAEAVSALLAGGADPMLPNKSGSTPLKLALVPTGRGGSGSAVAKAQQAEIVRLLEASAAAR
jgi:Ankyrin repeats (many copies)/Ankyrin repeat